MDNKRPADVDADVSNSTRPSNGRRQKKPRGPPPAVPSRPGQCHYLLPHKNRHCSLTAKANRKYCGEHHMYDLEALADEAAAAAESSSTITAAEATSATISGDAVSGKTPKQPKGPRKRIPCPYDPSHTAWEDDLKGHLFKCNARPKENPPEHEEDVNLALDRPTAEEVSTKKMQPDALSRLSSQELLALVTKVRSLYDQYVPELKTEVLDHIALDDRKKSLKNIKHAQQQASLIGHMDVHEMLSDQDACFVEFGCGRGELSNYIKQAMEKRRDEGVAQDKTCHSYPTYVLVDRSPPRNKFDGQIAGLKARKYLVRRVTMDIKDLVLSRVQELRHGDDNDRTEIQNAKSDFKPVVAVSKHLCGGATDITLKCLVNYNLERQQDQRPNSVRGIVIALCCHQLCHHSMYSNQCFLQEAGISAEEFAYISRMSSWAVSENPGKKQIQKQQRQQEELQHEDAREEDDGDDEETEHEPLAAESSESDEHGNHFSGFDYETRVTIGQQCKRLLDFGRVQYLSANGFDARLVYYVNQETSLENLALIATPHK